MKITAEHEAFLKKFSEVLENEIKKGDPEGKKKEHEITLTFTVKNAPAPESYCGPSCHRLSPMKCVCFNTSW